MQQKTLVNLPPLPDRQQTLLIDVSLRGHRHPLPHSLSAAPLHVHPLRLHPPLRLSSAADHLPRHHAGPLSALDPTQLRIDLLRCRCRITGVARLLIHRTRRLRCPGRTLVSEEGYYVRKGRSAQGSPMCSSSSARDQLSCLSSTRRVSAPIVSFTGVAGMLAPRTGWRQQPARQQPARQQPASGSSLPRAAACRHQLAAAKSSAVLVLVLLVDLL